MIAEKWIEKPSPRSRHDVIAIAVAPKDEVITRIAIDRVVAALADDAIVVCGAVQNVVGIIAANNRHHEFLPWFKPLPEPRQ